MYRYQFDTKTATFHICSVCGIVPVVTSEIEGNLYAIVNVNTLDNIDIELIKNTTTDFNDENEEFRLARRKNNWIADVSFQYAVSVE